MDRLMRQIEFLIEIDKLKSIFRKARLINKSRFENDAEHTWHLIIMSVVLAEYANEPMLDWLRVMKLLLIHDIVEIDAGDTFAYDEAGHEDKYEREHEAAERIFRLLPEDQAKELYELWIEFEERMTPEAKYAVALDRLHPMLLNYHTEGWSWKEYGVTSDMALKRNRTIAEGSEALWELAQKLIQDAEAKGYFSAKPKPKQG